MVYYAYLVVTSLAAAANVYAAANEFTCPDWLLANMQKLGVHKRSLPALGVLKALGAVGLMAGIWIPAIGVAAAAGLILYFVGAMVTVMRARWYAHLPYPLIWFSLAVGSLVLRVLSA